MTSAELPELTELLRSLPWTNDIPTRAAVLRGKGLAALPDERPGDGSKIVYAGTRTENGVQKRDLRPLRVRRDGNPAPGRPQGE